MADATYGQGAIRREQGNNRLVAGSGGSIDVESGAELDIESGAAFKLAGTEVTATAKELNALADQPAQAAVTATADGLTTGLIPPTAKLVLITSADANHIATLPGIAANSLGIGHTIRGRIVATGCEIRALASSGEKINSVDASGGNEAALAANTAFEAIVESATGWQFSVGAATVPD